MCSCRFDAEMQQLQEALRQEKTGREKALRERDMTTAEKTTAEQNLAVCCITFKAFPHPETLTRLCQTHRCTRMWQLKNFSPPKFISTFSVCIFSYSLI